MSVSGISTSGSILQATPTPRHHHRRAESTQPNGASQLPQPTATTSNGNGSASYHGVSGASGRIDTHA